MGQFGLTKEFFSNLQFLNEKHSFVYCLTFFSLLLFTGGFGPLAKASIGGLLIAFLVNRFIINKRQPIPSATSVVITGCSTGIGREAALHFASQLNLTVFATVRKQADADALLKAVPESSRSNVVPVICDVTQEESIQEAVKQVEAELARRKLTLLALINNAGHGLACFQEKLDQEAVKKVYNVNVFGVLNTTNAFLPLLRRYNDSNASASKLNAKVINVSSIMGKFSIASAGVYASTKYAVEALTHGYRGELKAMGIDVVSVQPGLIGSEFHTKTTQFTHAELTDEPEVNQYYNSAENILLEGTKNQSNHSPCSVVVNVLEDVICSPKPLPVYIAGKDAHIVSIILAWAWPDFFDLAIKAAFSPLATFVAKDKKTQ